MKVISRMLAGVAAGAASVVVTVMVVVPQTAGATPVAAGPNTPHPGRVKVFEQHPFYTHEQGLGHPEGATYLDGRGMVAVAQHRPGGSEVALLKLSTDTIVGRMTVAGLDHPATLADDGHGRLAALAHGKLLTWAAGAHGAAKVRTRPIVGAVPSDPRGMAYDPASRRWLVLDGALQRLVVLDQHGGTVQATDGPSLAGLGASELRGVALDPISGRLYVADPQHARVYAVDRNGQQQAELDTSDVQTDSVRSLALGSTADPTDDTAVSSLYVADAGGTSTYGKVSEVSLTALGQAAAAAPTTSTAKLVRKSLLSQLSPPSPDPSGIVYMSDSDRLLVADSEVDEMSIYKNVNMWQISRNDTVQYDVGNTLKFSREPTGIGYDPTNKRVFISDDDKRRVFEVTTGVDNRFGTADDPVNYISTTAFGDDDPEDVTYDTKTGDLFVTQGVGQEVWRVSPGPDGRFDGVAPNGDDVVTHFDTSVYGITDLEGIGYSPTRDSLFLADRKYTKVVEVTTAGALVQSIDVSGINMNNPASITLAPATNDPTRTDLYLTTRGVDNDNHPTENDGTMYELSAPNLGPTVQQANQAPVVSAGSDQSVTLPASAILSGSVSDDGLPNPPGFTTVTWSKASGPGTVTFGDAHAVGTEASFSAAGTYVLRLTATDSDLTVSDNVTVVVNPAAPTNTAPSVYAGADQEVLLPASASLSGLVSDDGLPNPPGTTTVTWSVVSGPGTVTFADPNALATTAGFSLEGTYVLRLTATDSALSASDDVTVLADPPPPSGNLVHNAGFETDTSGWKGSTGTTLSRVATPHSGSWSGQVANTGTASTTCKLNDSPNWVSTTVPATYTATAWVKGDAASVGSAVRLELTEYVGQVNGGTVRSSVTLTGDWQQVAVTYVPSAPGSSTLDLQLIRSSTPAGAVCFLADDISVTEK